MKHTDFAEWEMLLEILKNLDPHRNFNIPGEIKGRFYDPTDDLGMFPVAARIKTLREKRYLIKAGQPWEFGIEQIRQGDYYYQLLQLDPLPKPESEPEPEPESEPEPKPMGKPITMEIIEASRKILTEPVQGDLFG